MKYLILLTFLFLGLMMFLDYKEFNNCYFPQFTEEENIQICIEEGIY